ncbi:hypothetical protein [Mesorhizobium sp. M00.F.Ca.ET.216.01.1.1]|nr:hypothetical protein [Mesorhizobium sp. M00.F.Ca.ET.216.01.1.1]
MLTRNITLGAATPENVVVTILTGVRAGDMQVAGCWNESETSQLYFG